MSRPFDEPAFPCEEHPENTLLYTGMTIGDVYAAVAMHAIITAKLGTPDAKIEQVAEAVACYMLKLRQKPDQTISRE
jgi:hypothetical protein